MNEESEDIENESIGLDTDKNEPIAFQEDRLKKYDSTIKSLINEGCPI